MNRSEAGRRGYEKTRQWMEGERRRKSQAALEKYEQEHRHCPQCQARIPFAKRRHRFCSRTCRDKFRRGVRRNARQLCVNCGRELPATARKFCGFVCQREYQYRHYVEEWLAGRRSGNRAGAMGVSDHVRRWLIEQRGERCEQCGWAERHPKTGRIPVQVDHIDGNAENTVPGNLRLLCPNCHSLTESFGALNKGRGRSARYGKGRTPVEED